MIVSFFKIFLFILFCQVLILSYVNVSFFPFLFFSLVLILSYVNLKCKLCII